MVSYGFKEWKLVCEALGSGRQSVILRKGGIHEGPEGFRFKHQEFFLFPTLFHEQVARTTLPPETAIPSGSPGVIEVRSFVRVEWTESICDWEIARALGAFHIWCESEIESRFQYENAGLNLALVRVFQLSEPWEFPDAPKYGGCRSWVELPEPPAGVTFAPVIDDATYQQHGDAVRAILGA